MRKNYELLEVKIVSFDDEDIIVTSAVVDPTPVDPDPVDPEDPTPVDPPSGNAVRFDDLLGGSFDLGGLDTQSF